MNLLEKLIERCKGIKTKSLEVEQIEGNQAAIILRDGIFSNVVDDMRKTILTSWRESPIRDVEARERLRLMIEILDSIVKNIENAYITGEMATKQIKERDQKKARN